MDADLYGNPEAIFQRIQFCHDLSFECAMPAKITKVNNDHTAYAQPLIKLMSSISSIEQVPILVTTLWTFHGDFEIHHPLNVGDTGWLVAADRNTDLVKQYNCERDETKNNGAQQPNSDKNLHRYRFGFFIPDRWDRQDYPKQTVPKELQDCFYIQDRNGYVQMLLDEDGRIAITAKSAVEIYGDLFTYDGNATFGGDVTFKGDVKANCDVTVDGKVLCDELEVINKTQFNRDVTINGSVYVNGKSSRINDMIEQEITVVTGVTQDANNNTILRLEKMKVLRTNKEHDKDVTITVPKQEGGGGGGGGLSGIIVEGTDGNSVTSSIGKIVFKSAKDSNVVVKCTQNDNVVEAEVGVYYL